MATRGRLDVARPSWNTLSASTRHFTQLGDGLGSLDGVGGGNKDAEAGGACVTFKDLS